jgi:hypothetical protein
MEGRKKVPRRYPQMKEDSSPVYASDLGDAETLKKTSRTYRPSRPKTPIEKLHGMKEVPVRQIAPHRGTKGRGAMTDQDPLDRLSEFDRLAIQLDMRAGVPISQIAGKYMLSTGQVRQVNRLELNMTGQMRERLEGTATAFVQHAGRMLTSITPEKIEHASLGSLNLAAAIAVDKAVQIDKHLHGTEEHQGNLIVNFGSREALEKALMRKFKQSPVFKALLGSKEVKLEDVSSLAPHAESAKKLASQLEMFPGNEERTPTVGEGLFAGKEVIAPGLLRKKKISPRERAEDRAVEKDLDEDWGSHG